jgi:uncharacterized protein YecT (DUF1311 family)
MIIGWRRLGAISAVAIGLGAVACDSGAPSKTRDEIAADSALASDLALANRDTLLVDSIGEYRPPDAAERDTAGSGDFVTIQSPTASKAGVASAAPPPGKKIEPTPAPVTVSPPLKSQPAKPIVVAPPAPAAVPAPAPAPTVASGPTRRGAAACSSPLKADQEECVKAILPGADRQLNRIYRALVTEMRLREGVRGGGADPASVERLRISQRSWLVYRDNQCRKRGRGKEGALWARPRVRCLAEFSTRRANELADQFSRLTAH